MLNRIVIIIMHTDKQAHPMIIVQRLPMRSSAKAGSVLPDSLSAFHGTGKMRCSQSLQLTNDKHQFYETCDELSRVRGQSYVGDQN
jgi:hypothetical protein